MENFLSEISIKALNCFNEIISKPIRTTNIGKEHAQILGNLLNNMYGTMLLLLQNFVNIFTVNDSKYGCLTNVNNIIGSKKLELIEKFSEGPEEQFIDKMNLIIMGFIEFHISRILLLAGGEEVSNDLMLLGLNFPVNSFLEILFTYTTTMFTTENYQTSLATWIQLIDMVYNSNDDVLSIPFIDTYKQALLALVDDVMKRIQFSKMNGYFNNKFGVTSSLLYLEDLDDEKRDNQNYTELDNYLDICVDFVGNVAETFQTEVFSKFFEQFNALIDVELMQNIFGKLIPTRVQQQQPFTREENNYMKTACKDLRGMFALATRLSNIFVHLFDETFSISSAVISKVLTIQNAGIRKVFSENSSQVAQLLKGVSVNAVGLYGLTEETFTFLQQYTRWVFLFGSNISKRILESMNSGNTTVPQELIDMQSQYISLVSGIIDNVVEVFVLSSTSSNVIIPYEIINASASLLLYMSNALAQVSLTQQNPLNSIAYKHTYSCSIDDIKSVHDVLLPNMTHVLTSLASRYPPVLEKAEQVLSWLFVSLSNSILNKLKLMPFIIQNPDIKQIQNTVFENYEKWIGGQLVAPFNQAIQMLMSTPNNMELIQYISLLFKIAQSIFRNTKHHEKTQKLICYQVMSKFIAPDLIVNLMDFTLKSSDKHVMELLEIILDLLHTLFSDWKTEVGSEYINGIINHFMDILTKSSSVSQFMKDPVGRNVLNQFLKLLKALVSEGSGKYAGIIGKIIAICKNLLYPELREVSEGKLSGNSGAIEVLPNYYELLYSILHYNWKYFFAVTVGGDIASFGSQEQQVRSPQAFEEFCFIIECFLNSFHSKDITVVKKNLLLLDELNDRQKLFERSIFKQTLPSFGNNSMFNGFTNVFLNILIAKSHNLLKKELLLVLYNMVNANNWVQFGTYIQEFLSGDKLAQKLNNDQKQQLFVRLVVKPDHVDEGEWKSLQNFSRRVSQFTNDLSFSVNQNTRSGLSFLTMV